LPILELIKDAMQIIKSTNDTYRQQIINLC